MQSDERRAMALGALARPIGEFRAALAGAATQARTWLDAASIDAPGRAARAARELGDFAAGRISSDKFSETFAAKSGATPDDRDRVARALAVLEEVLGEGDHAFLFAVERGGSLTRLVDDALSHLGRAFGAMAVVDLVRGHRFSANEHEALLDRLPFRSWTRAERRLAPPLVISVEGADLQVGGLTDFTDGRVKIVLLVGGVSAPAPLVRLITPGTLVLQTSDATGLDRVANADGPAIAALVPENAALFLHDPAAGRETWQRISMWGQAKQPSRALGGISVWHMAEDLHQLGALATAPLGSNGAPGSAGIAQDTTERLARWLIGRADVS